MTARPTLDELLRALDPLNDETRELNDAARSDVWDLVKERARRPRTAHRRQALVGTGVLGVAVAALVALAVGLVATAPPLSAAAATLKRAATVDAPAAALPVLGAGEYYYQDSVVSQVCSFADPSMTSNITYVAYGTMQSWSNGDGSGRVTVTPSTLDGAGSHFATPQDEAAWVAAGKPFVPCALADTSNELAGNPANANTVPAFPGDAFSVSGYAGFGFFLGPQGDSFSSSELVGATNINNLPSDPATIEAMLADGEIGLDGSLSSTPQVCPWGGNGDSIGCSDSQQVSIIQHLMSAPESSAKLGSVLYQVLSQMPGVMEVGTVTTPGGQSGVEIIVPNAQNEQFAAVLNPATGLLISCSELISGDLAPAAQITYGPISVVQGIGATS
jgi:hypothetical protein